MNCGIGQVFPPSTELHRARAPVLAIAHTWTLPSASTAAVGIGDEN